MAFLLLLLLINYIEWEINYIITYRMSYEICYLGAKPKKGVCVLSFQVAKQLPDTAGDATQ